MKIIVSVILLLLSAHAMAYKNEPDGFRGIKWLDPLSNNQEELILVSQDKTTTLYSRKDESLKIGEADLDAIVYGYTDKGLSAVMIKSSGYQNQKALTEIFNTQFGRGTQRNRYIERYIWLGNTTTILLDCAGRSSECTATFISKEISRIQDAELKQQAREASKDF